MTRPGNSWRCARSCTPLHHPVTPGHTAFLGHWLAGCHRVCVPGPCGEEAGAHGAGPCSIVHSGLTPVDGTETPAPCQSVPPGLADTVSAGERQRDRKRGRIRDRERRRDGETETQRESQGKRWRQRERSVFGLQVHRVAPSPPGLGCGVEGDIFYHQPKCVSCSVISDSATLLSMEFSRQEYWSGLPFPSPENLPNPGIKPGSPTVQADSLPSEPLGKPAHIVVNETELGGQIRCFK